MGGLESCSGGNNATSKDWPLENGLSGATARAGGRSLIVTTVMWRLLILLCCRLVISNFTTKAVAELVDVPQFSCVVGPLSKNAFKVR